MPYTDDMALPEEDSYHFISECFFLAHQAVHIGYSIVYKIMKLNNSILKLKKIHEEMKNLYPKRVVELVRNQLKKGKDCTPVLEIILLPAFKAAIQWNIKLYREQNGFSCHHTCKHFKFGNRRCTATFHPHLARHGIR